MLHCTSFYVILPFYCSVISHTKIIIVCEQLIGGLLPCSDPFFFWLVYLFALFFIIIPFSLTPIAIVHAGHISLQ